MAEVSSGPHGRLSECFLLELKFVDIVVPYYP